MTLEIATELSLNEIDLVDGGSAQDFWDGFVDGAKEIAVAVLIAIIVA